MDEAPKKFAVSLETILKETDQDVLLEQRKRALENPETKRAVAAARSVKGARAKAPGEQEIAPAVLSSGGPTATEEASAERPRRDWKRPAMAVAAVVIVGAPLLTWALGRGKALPEVARVGADATASVTLSSGGLGTIAAPKESATPSGASASASASASVSAPSAAPAPSEINPVKIPRPPNRLPPSAAPVATDIVP
jgi:hypothetical protein